MFRATSSRMAGFVFRENRVPYYQRLFQNHDGKRQWWKTSRSGYIMYPYLISVYGLGAASTYAMCRMVFVSFTHPLLLIPRREARVTDSICSHADFFTQGHKTWI
ncbi:hypothetical protein PCG10_002973 [Penicillium crustosum]|uniref:Uncharacterized protein n=1 Tax=Penicillium crustosum TaxID=36656 RepID=A0A9P5KYP7_PENCR|nr:hypothetical protein PCG10_002973 [Penicillium crustosum]